jgi:uncharacterized protein YutE (UPF0331/DUF86 family)
MKTIADAWNWHKATKQNLARMQRLGEKHWSDASLADASLWQDDHFRRLEAADIVAETTASLKPIDDLAVVVLFSVFESHVRDYLMERIRPHAESISDPILKGAADDAIQGVREGSFYRRVLEPLKRQQRVSADLVTQVDQVREYRNWVAHGRRDVPTNNVTPEMAYDRLREFLAALGIAAESEEGPPDWPGEERE